MVSYRSSVDTNSVSCSVSVILHLNPETYFWPILRDLGPHFGGWKTRVQYSKSLKGFGVLDPCLTHGYCCRGCVPEISCSLSSKPFGHNSLASQTDRQTNDDKSLTLGYRPTRDRSISTRGQIVVKKILRRTSQDCGKAVDNGLSRCRLRRRIFWPQCGVLSKFFTTLQVTPMHRAVPLQKDPAVTRHRAVTL